MSLTAITLSDLAWHHPWWAYIPRMLHRHFQTCIWEGWSCANLVCPTLRSSRDCMCSTTGCWCTHWYRLVLELPSPLPRTQWRNGSNATSSPARRFPMLVHVNTPKDLWASIQGSWCFAAMYLVAGHLNSRLPSSNVQKPSRLLLSKVSFGFFDV